MTDTLTSYVERSFPVSLVRFVGTLDIGNGPAVRRALLSCLEMQPVAVVVDLGSAAVASTLALALFAAIGRRLRGWPGTRIILAGVEDSAAVEVDHLDGSGHLQVCPTPETAREMALRLPVPHRVRRRLAPTLEAPRLARETVIETCAAWGLADPVSNAQLIASELVSNAVLHAGTDLEFGMQLRDSRLYLSVHDRDRQAVRRRFLPEPAEHGRGLLLIDALAADWGRAPVDDGKVVWAALAAVKA
jgi:anti-anti-sigma regulatory factor/anti-sigma regulatory factor (Ser/Thr protein kinase)